MPDVTLVQEGGRWEAWRFLTYGLVHVGYLHLLSNCCVQLMLGVPLEVRL